MRVSESKLLFRVLTEQRTTIVVCTPLVLVQIIHRNLGYHHAHYNNNNISERSLSERKKIRKPICQTKHRFTQQCNMSSSWETSMEQGNSGIEFQTFKTIAIVIAVVVLFCFIAKIVVHILPRSLLVAESTSLYSTGKSNFCRSTVVLYNITFRVRMRFGQGTRRWHERIRPTAVVVTHF